jgi:amino acid transporter
LRWGLLTVISFVLGYLNWLGLKIVGRITIVVGLVSLLPFLVMAIIGAFQVDPSRWLMMPNPEYADKHRDIYDGLFPHLTVGNIIWRPFLNNLFWKLNSFDHAAHFAGDVQDPGTTFPRGMFLAVVLVFFTYMIPLLVAIGATDSYQADWVDGYLSYAARLIGGHWLGAWVVFAAGVSNVGMFQAELSKNALLMTGMAERGYLPKILETRSQQGTPTYSIILCLVVVMFMCIASFETLVQIMNFNYSIALLMEFAAFIKLRISYPNCKWIIMENLFVAYCL